MKTYVIQLESQDDLISIRDKMDWAKSPRILLLWPHGRQVSVRALDLALLRRHAAALGAELGVVARSDEIRRAARKLAVPVFETSAEAQRKPWFVRSAPRQPRRAPGADLRALRDAARTPDPLEPRTPLARLGAFASGVGAVMLLLALFLPSATVRLSPNTQLQAITLPVNVAPDIESVLLSGTLPAHTITATVQASETAKTTGAIQSPDRPAQGAVEFSNITDAPVSIPAGTVVRTLGTPSVRFATQDRVAVEAGNGKSSRVAVRALDFGTSGNLKPGAIQAIEGSLGLSLIVTNPDATHGGSDLSSPAPQPEDRERLREGLIAALQQTALAQMQAQMGSNDVLLAGTIALSRTLVESYMPSSDTQPSGALSLTLQAEFEGYYAAADELAYLARSALDASLPAGFEPRADSLKLTPAGELVTASDGSTRFQLRAERTIAARIDAAQVVQLARGHLVGTAGQRLTSAFMLAGLPEIEMFPSWWPWLPIVPFRIAVTQ